MEPSKLRTMFYTIVTLLGLAYFGNVSEVCSTARTCPDRYGAVIAMGVLTVLLSIGSAVVCLLTLPKLIELILVGIAIITNTVACAVVLSPKSLVFDLSLLDSLVLITWTAEIFLVIALFNILFAEDDDTPLLPTKVTDPADATPLKQPQQQAAPPAPPSQEVPATATPAPYAPAPAQATSA